MDPLRISATTLELWRLFLQPEQDWCTEADLIAAIKGEAPPAPHMLLGRAYHAILEHPERYRVNGGYLWRDRDGGTEYAFEAGHMQLALDRYDRRGVSEVKGTIEVDGCTLVAKADLLAGTAIHEFKTTDSYSFDVEKYGASVQWRVMSLIFQPAAIHYHVASVDDHGNSVVEIRWLDSLALYPYQALEDDVRAVLASFKSYVVSKGLDEELRQRARAAA